MINKEFYPTRMKRASVVGIRSDGTNIFREWKEDFIKNIMYLTNMEVFRYELAKDFHRNANNKSWIVLHTHKNAIPNFPCHLAVAMFCLVTGHDCLAAHFCKLSIYESPKCVICNIEVSVMNRDHLWKCPVLTVESCSESSAYWEARHPSV